MFDLLPGTLFWVKDIHGRILHANQQFVRHVGAKSLKQILGQTDIEFSPPHIAQQFLEDDKRVVQTGESITDRLELNQQHDGDLTWFTTSKRPLYDQLGEVVGSYGISSYLDNSALVLTEIKAINAPVEFIRNNYAQNISIEEIAESAHLSVSALERRFQKHLHRTPNQYLVDVRLQNARKLLVESDLPIGLLANRCGFQDSSYFSRRFKRKFGILPSQFRRVHQS